MRIIAADRIVNVDAIVVGFMLVNSAGRFCGSSVWCCGGENPNREVLLVFSPPLSRV